MDMKKAIKVLKSRNEHKLYRYSTHNIEELNEAVDTLIELSERGGAYEKIYNELEGDYKHLPFSVAGCTLHSMRILKDKYFPKPKPEKWERFINIDFDNSESVIVKMIVTKDVKGNIMISYEPQYKWGDTLERGDTNSEKKV